MEREGVLGNLVRECLEGGSGEGEFPPPLRTPSSEELLQVVVRFRDLACVLHLHCDSACQGLQCYHENLLSHNAEFYIQQILIIAILIVDLNFRSLCICIE